MIIPIFLITLILFYVGYLHYSYVDYRHNVVNSYKVRIHVNGIRGKSSVTRLIAGALRKSGKKTLAKTTGSAARIIDENGVDIKIPRKEANIAEQIEILKKYSDKGFEAAVLECMAIKPEYAAFLEHKVMHSTIMIITNVRQDHMDQLGDTVEEIAESMAYSIPYNGVVITAETSPSVLKILRQRSEERNSTLIHVKAESVKDSEMSKFDHIEFKDNVAIALKVAKLLGISRKVALEGMYEANPDPGVLRFKHLEHSSKSIVWANAFAANDSDSFIKILDLIQNNKDFKNHKKAIILNNRKDRPERVKQFADIVIKREDIDYLVTFGDYESEVKRYINNSKKIFHFGNSSENANLNGEELLKGIVEHIGEDNLVLIGAINIHTVQADRFLEFVEHRQH